jgi:hypothetical protein
MASELFSISSPSEVSLFFPTHPLPRSFLDCDPHYPYVFVVFSLNFRLRTQRCLSKLLDEAFDNRGCYAIWDERERNL